MRTSAFGYYLICYDRLELDCRDITPSLGFGAAVETSTGSIHLRGGLTANAIAYGGNSVADGANSGSGRGGTFNILAELGTGEVTIDGAILATVGGNGGDSSSAAGGLGQGGTSSIGVNAGQLSLGDVSVNVDGIGGRGNSLGGTGRGGQVDMDAAMDGGTINARSVTLLARGDGGNIIQTNDSDGALVVPTGSSGGTGQGGRAGFTATHGSISVSDNSYVDTSGTGGSGFDGGIGMGGAPDANDPDYGAHADAYSGSLSFQGGSINLAANGNGGTAQFDAAGPIGIGGAGKGGRAELYAGTDLANPTASLVEATNLYLNAIGTGGGGNISASDVPARPAEPEVREWAARSWLALMRVRGSLI